MGFFDRLTGKKPAPSAPAPSAPAPAPAETAAPAPAPATAGGVLPQLAAAKARLAARDLPAAMAIYEQVLAVSGDRADVLLTVSADLGVHGHIRELIEVVAPRYDAERHGPGPGLNLLQAYLAARSPEAAQHLLDLLFSLNRPELEARLIGFSRALAELSLSESSPVGDLEAGTKISLVSISKPIWFYGLEDRAAALLPAKEGRLRRVAFAQCALLGEANLMERAAQPEDAVGRFTRGLPLWFAETFGASAGYDPIAGIGLFAPKHYALFPMEWAAENIRQLDESAQGGLDYVVTFALRSRNADYELGARIWEVKKFRELKTFTTRWAPADADAVLAQFHQQLKTYMEWQPAAAGLAYAPPAAPLSYIQALGGSLTLFLGEKQMLPPEQIAAPAALFLQAAQANPADARAQLALVTALQRLQARGAAPDEAALAHARAWLASDAASAAGVAGVAV
ncbi:hypothetical protein [Oleiharenicola sp. Vm1]|uniref:hypothetical protein n=1 Tax=Oleiharenicola sp. Vm1 TaxID=3398393 RepID=UPI0039F5B68A